MKRWLLPLLLWALPGLCQEEETLFSLKVNPVKERYKTGEPIRFRVRASKDCYLYMYWIDPSEN
jgi:hypothetical protein